MKTKLGSPVVIVAALGEKIWRMASAETPIRMLTKIAATTKRRLFLWLEDLPAGGGVFDDVDTVGSGVNPLELLPVGAGASI